MHKTKIDYLRKHFPEEDCFSAITRVELDYMTVGSPVMVNMKPFVPNSKTQHRAVYVNGSSFTRSSGSGQTHSTHSTASLDTVNDTSDRVQAQPLRSNQSNAYSNSPYKGSYKTGKHKDQDIKKDVKKVSVKDLYTMGIVKANEMLQRKAAKVGVMFAFSFYKDYQDHYVNTMQSHQVYFDGKKPLIYDEGHKFELKRLSDVHSKNYLNNFAEMIADSLKEDRYINYSFGEIASSNKKYIFEDINIIFNSLKKVFPENFSFFRSILNDGRLRSLVDTVSISFYRIQDIIAIFDSKKTSGMGVEIFLTNSVHKPTAMSKSETVATYRFLFSKSRENILTIDGESIRRQHNTSTNDTLGTAFSVINKNIPIDNELKKKSARRLICAE